MDFTNIPLDISESLYIIRTDIQNKITYVSKGILTLTGYTEEELLGKHPSILRDKSSRKEPIINLMFKLNNSGSWNGILKNQKKDGTIYYQNANMHKEFDTDGNHIGYIAINTDISQTIKNPAEFIFESNMFDLFFSNEQDLVALCLCVSDYIKKPKLLDVSDHLLKLLDTNRDYVLDKGLSFADLLSKNSPYFKNQEKLISDYKINNDMKIEINSFNDPNKLYICRLTITDFEYKGNLARLFKLTNITEEIKNAKKLEELNQSKNTFLANFSHEIRTPLNATIGFMELMKDQTTDHTMLEYMNIVLDNSKHLLDMMNDVIDFTSVDNNKLEIVPRQFSPKDIQSTIEIFYAKSLEKEIDFTVFLSPQLPERMTQDILRIKQIISNLLSNALKFTDYGGKIVVDVFNSKEKIYINIEDSGIGMDSDQIAKIFNPFQQASSETELRYGGTGLGLSVVKKIIEKMGGEIVVESAPDIGTKFKVELPLLDYVEKALASKLDIKNVYVYTPSFSPEKIVILKRYIRHFTEANIIITKIIPDVVEYNDITIIFKDDIEIEYLESLTKKNKIILLKKFNDILASDKINENNIQELNLPLLGSKLYDSFYSLIHNKLLLKTDTNKINTDFKLSGKILIAEDMKANVLLIENILTKFPDLEYIIVENGKKALETYLESVENNKSLFDIIFLDENMPGMSGSTAAAKIRDYEKINNIHRTPLIALTANRYGNRNDRALLDMDEYISKPIDIKELFSILLKYTSADTLSNIPNSKSDKIMRLKEFRDKFMKGDSQIMDIIDGLADILRTSDIGELKRLVYDNDKKAFNQFYNSIIKNIRKENK
jgi:PAS domain S-box-containing protein